MDVQVKDIIEVLEELTEDETIPKNVKLRLNNAVKELQSSAERNVAIHKALSELDELSDNTTMASYTRSQILNIVSLLESIS